MYEKLKRLAPVFYSITLVVVLVTIISSAILSENEHTRFGANENIISITQVTLDGKGTIDIPQAIPVKRGEEFTVSFRLPEHLPEGAGFMFSNGYCACTIEVDGEEIASYGRKQPLPYGNMLGNIRVIAPLTQEMGGRVLTIHLKAVYGLSWTLDRFLIGEISNLRYSVLIGEIWCIVACAFFIALVVVAQGISHHHYAQQRMNRARMYTGLCAFLCCIVVWLICNSDLPQFVTSQNEVVSLTSFLALTLLGPSFMFFCNHSLSRGQKAFFYMSIIGMLLPLVNCILFLADIADPVYLMYLTHVYIVGGALLASVNSLRSWKTSPESRILTTGILVLVVFAGIALIFFYRNPMGRLPSILLVVGLAIFSFAMLSMLLAKEQRMIGEQTSTDLLRRMAFMDGMTNCSNRAAFERDVDLGVKAGRSRLTLVMFDLNRLKVTNDQLGHQAGDEMIRGLSSSIVRAFAPRSECYRLGGDEFAALMWDCEDEVEYRIARLRSLLEEYNSEHIVQLSCAIGYATADCRKDQDFFKKLYSAADQKMYRNKMQCHKEMDRETGKGEVQE